MLFEHEFGAFLFQVVVDLVEGAADQMNAQATRLNEIERAALELGGESALGAIVPQPEAHTGLDLLLTNQADVS